MFFFLPEWIPWWVQLSILLVIVVFSLCFLLMPFSVFGIKSRLNYLDQQMEDIQAQLRILLKRLPEPKERYEVRVESTPMHRNEAMANAGFVDEQDRSASPASSEYAQPQRITTRNRQTRFDPPYHEEEQNLSRMSAMNYENNHSEQVQKHLYSEERYANIRSADEEMIYNPPPKENKESPSTHRRRAEPILRWPPK